MPTLDELLRHVATLCINHGVLYVPAIKMIGKPEEAGTARHPRTGQAAIVVAPFTNETDYAIALHELGHILHPNGSTPELMSPSMRRRARERRPACVRDMDVLLMNEESAWDWALDHALDWTPAMQQVKDICLGKYREQREQYKVFARTVSTARRGKSGPTIIKRTTGRDRS